MHFVVPSQPPLSSCFQFLGRNMETNTGNASEAAWPEIPILNHSYWVQELKAKRCVWSQAWGLHWAAHRETARERDSSRIQARNATAGGDTRSEEFGRATGQDCPVWSWSRSQQGWGQRGYLGAGTWAEGTAVWLVYSASNEILRDWTASRWLATAACLVGFGRNSCKFRYFWSK